MKGDTTLTGRVLEAALAVHRELGPGLLESTYKVCLVHELREHALSVQAEVSLPISYRGRQISAGYRIDLLVEGRLLLEIKAVQALNDLHTAQVLTYLKLSRIPVGLLINFNVPLLKQGIRRLVLGSPSPSEGTDPAPHAPDRHPVTPPRPPLGTPPPPAAGEAGAVRPPVLRVLPVHSSGGAARNRSACRDLGVPRT